MNNQKISWSIKPENTNRCPSCNKIAKIVPASAANTFIKENIKKTILSLEGFYFCDTMTCDTVYFKKNMILKQNNLNFSIGIKENATLSTLCYCFNWTKEKIENQIKSTGRTTAIEEISKKTQEKDCNCAVKNPRGKCCLGDVKKFVKEIKAKLAKDK